MSTPGSTIPFELPPTYHVPSLLELPVIRYLAIACGVVVALVVVVIVPLASWGSRKQTSAEIGQPGVYGITGRFGSGKSLLMAWFVINGNKKERQILSNMNVKGGERFYTWLDLMWKADDGALILIDEVSLWWPAGNVRSPLLLDAWIRQVRKRNITILWATQGWTHTAKRLRELTFACWMCRKIDGHHVYTLHEASQMGRANGGEKLTKLHVARSKKVRSAYNTNELVEPGGWADVPDDVSINEMLAASGRRLLSDDGNRTRWSPRPKDGPTSTEWLASLSDAQPAPERERQRARRRPASTRATDPAATGPATSGTGHGGAQVRTPRRATVPRSDRSTR